MISYLFIASMFILSAVFFMDSLIKKTLGFIVLVLSLMFYMENWMCYLILLVYIGGLFILLVYMSSFSFKANLTMVNTLKFLVMFGLFISFAFSGVSGLVYSSGFWVFLLKNLETYGGFIFLFLLTVFLFLNWLLPSGKTSRNIF